VVKMDEVIDQRFCGTVRTARDCSSPSRDAFRPRADQGVAYVHGRAAVAPAF
jgi:hypothetical protein